MRLQQSQLTAILTAYEGGVRQGQKDSTVGNPYERFTTEWDAWIKGYNVGIKEFDEAQKRAKIEPDLAEARLLAEMMGFVHSVTTTLPARCAKSLTEMADTVERLRASLTIYSVEEQMPELCFQEDGHAISKRVLVMFSDGSADVFRAERDRLTDRARWPDYKLGGRQGAKPTHWMYVPDSAALAASGTKAKPDLVLQASFTPKPECVHDWEPESKVNNWRETCRKCGTQAQGSGQ